MKFGFLAIAVFAGVLNPFLGRVNAMPGKARRGHDEWARPHTEKLSHSFDLEVNHA